MKSHHLQKVHHSAHQNEIVNHMNMLAERTRHPLLHLYVWRLQILNEEIASKVSSTTWMVERYLATHIAAIYH
jgi:hypothetical protein